MPVNPDQDRSLTLVIQAGGESRRMGYDKGLASFLGQSLVERLVHRLDRLADEILVTTNNPAAYQFLGLKCVPDKIPGRGALVGIYTALSAASYPAVAIVACDMPFANPGLMQFQRDLLFETPADLVIPRTEQGWEPFHAVYRRETCLPHVQAALQAGRRRADSWFSRVRLRPIGQAEITKYDPTGLAFLNVNTPQDLKLAETQATQLENGNK